MPRSSPDLTGWGVELWLSKAIEDFVRIKFLITSGVYRNGIV